jgi:hypothetical protein
MPSNNPNIKAERIAGNISVSGIETGVVSKAVAYTLTVNDNTVYVTVAGATQTLPTAVGFVGVEYEIINRSNGTVLVNTTSSQTIGNLSVGNPTSITLQVGESLSVKSDNANWLAQSFTANTPIVGATKTKITYDSRGFVTAGADATTADINDSSNRRYVTDAQLVVIGNTSGTNTGDQTSIVGITGTKAQFDTACTDGDFLYVGDVLTSLKTKSGVVASGTFAGNPKKATVTFATAFADANYSVSVLGVDSRSWSVESYVAGSFVINANANLALTGNVYWTAIKNGEN